LHVGIAHQLLLKFGVIPLTEESIIHNISMGYGILT